MDLVHAETDETGGGWPGLFFLALEEILQDRRTVLQREVGKVRTQIAELEKTLKERPDYGLGKGNPAAARREVDRALLQRLKPERLAALPDATSCVDCAQGTWLRCKKPGAVALK